MKDSIINIIVMGCLIVAFFSITSLIKTQQHVLRLEDHIYKNNNEIVSELKLMKEDDNKAADSSKVLFGMIMQNNKSIYNVYKMIPKEKRVDINY